MHESFGIVSVPFALAQPGRLLVLVHLLATEVEEERKSNEIEMSNWSTDGA